MRAIKRVFKVGGKPFFPVGGQACNSSGYNAKEFETSFQIIKLLHGNTLEIPVYWDIVEPKEGKFDFTTVDNLLASARRYDIKLILLWFATWKNGNMDYAPSWVKTNPQRFKRVISPTDGDIWNLSSHCAANLEADRKAFSALCGHLKLKDNVEQTVIGIQIENEPGIIGSNRDYSLEAQVVYDSPVPSKLMAEMKKQGNGLVYDLWQKTGGIKTGTWTQVFGWEGGELMTAWSIASYIDRIAASGKAVYDIPMYVNVWVMEQPWWSIPGESYPSGGAVTRVLDIYKWFTPHLDVIAPDNYHLDSKGFESICATYARDDNPLFLPETAGDPNMFRAIADYNSIGNFFFGIEHILKDNSIIPECQTTVDNIQCTAAVLPLLLKYQGTGNVHAVIQDDRLTTQLLDLGDFTGLIEFGEKKAPYVGKDWRHMWAIWLTRGPTIANPGSGLVIQSGPKEFYLVGANYRLYLRPKPTLDKTRAPLLIADGTAKLLAYIVSVDEGHFDRNGEFVADRRRNGDEISRGIWLEPDVGVVRMIMCD